MIRRTFIKKSVLVAAGGVFGAPTLARAKGQDLPVSLSLYATTDRPSEVVTSFQSWFGGRTKGLVHVTTHPLTGRHIGDIAVFRDNLLADYRTDIGPDYSELRTLAQRYELPRTIDNPTLVHFNISPVHSQPTRADIYSSQIFLGSLPLESDINEKLIETEHGSLRISIKNRRVRVVNASCKHKTCIKIGEIGSAGQSLACIPSRITITLDGYSSIDAITR